MKLKWQFTRGRWIATSEEGIDFIIYPEYGFLRQYYLYFRLPSWGHDVKHSSHQFLGDAKKAAENWKEWEATQSTGDAGKSTPGGKLCEVCGGEKKVYKYSAPTAIYPGQIMPFVCSACNGTGIEKEAPQ